MVAATFRSVANLAHPSGSISMAEGGMAILGFLDDFFDILAGSMFLIMFLIIVVGFFFFYSEGK